MRIRSDAPVVAWDIDGTLANYYEHFRKFAEAYTLRSLPVDWNRRYRGEFSEALGLEKEEYRRIKLAYRQGGQKRMLTPKYQAGETIRDLRVNGIQVWICTTRPWNSLANIDPDTQFWLETHIGRVDGVIYGEEKYEDLIEQVGKDRVLGVVDDLPENVRRAESLGLNWLLMRGDHNLWYREQMNEEQKNLVIDTPYGAGEHIYNWLLQYNNKKEKVSADA